MIPIERLAIHSAPYGRNQIHLGTGVNRDNREINSANSLFPLLPPVQKFVQAAKLLIASSTENFNAAVS
jgi:hypothetical protein